MEDPSASSLPAIIYRPGLRILVNGSAGTRKSTLLERLAEDARDTAGIALHRWTVAKDWRAAHRDNPDEMHAHEHSGALLPLDVLHADVVIHCRRTERMFSRPAFVWRVLKYEGGMSGFSGLLDWCPSPELYASEAERCGDHGSRD